MDTDDEKIDELADKIIANCDDNDTILEKLLDWMGIKQEQTAEDNTEVGKDTEEK